MKLLGIVILLVLALVGMFALLNWQALSVPVALSLLVGVVDMPLGLMLLAALVLLVALIWTALDLRALASHRSAVTGRPSRWVWPFAVLLGSQITLGAFVAGLDAGRIYNTWPMMNGTWIPRGLNELSPVWSNAVDNPVAVQFLHRWLAVVVAVAALAVAAQLFRAGARGYAIAVEAAVGAQFLLGVLTLLHSVPVALGVAHQTGAVVLLVVTVAAAHWSLGGARRLVTP